MSQEFAKKQEGLCGVWTLISWHSLNGEGQQRAPFGDDARGVLFYAADFETKDSEPRSGYMSAQLSGNARSPFFAPLASASREKEKCVAFDSYIAYAGRWRWEGARVIHQVEMSLYPNWTGTDLIRVVEFVDDRLVLSTVPDERNGAAHFLTWRRRGASSAS